MGCDDFASGFVFAQFYTAGAAKARKITHGGIEGERGGFFGCWARGTARGGDGWSAGGNVQILPLLALALPAPADETSETKLSVAYENAAFTNVLADIGAKMDLRLDRSVTNALPVVTLRADDIALGDLLSRLDDLAGPMHVLRLPGHRLVEGRRTGRTHGRATRSGAPLAHRLALRWRTFSDDYPFTDESSKALVQWLKDRGISADMD